LVPESVHRTIQVSWYTGELVPVLLKTSLAVTLLFRLLVTDRVTTLQTMRNSPTIPLRFATLLRRTWHVKCYLYHARTSIKYLYAHKYAVYNKQF